MFLPLPSFPVAASLPAPLSGLMPLVYAGAAVVLARLIRRLGRR